MSQRVLLIIVSHLDSVGSESVLYRKTSSKSKTIKIVSTYKKGYTTVKLTN